MMLQRANRRVVSELAIVKLRATVCGVDEMSHGLGDRTIWRDGEPASRRAGVPRTAGTVTPRPPLSVDP
jgi:hypothetical protein